MLKPFLERLVDAERVEDIRDCYVDAMAQFGFANLFYAARFAMDLPTTVINEKIEICSTMPDSFVKPFLERGMLVHSPWAQWVMRNSGSIPSPDLLRAQVAAGFDPAAREAVEMAERHGLLAGRVLSLRDKVLRSHGGVMLNPATGASQDEADRLWSRFHREITILSWIMHMRMATVPRHSPDARLTPRQVQVLEWSSAGKTVAETATILGLSPATIEKHLRLAREVLGVGSTSQAVLKAHVTNQLFMQNPADRRDG